MPKHQYVFCLIIFFVLLFSFIILAFEINNLLKNNKCNNIFFDGKNYLIFISIFI